MFSVYFLLEAQCWSWNCSTVSQNGFCKQLDKWLQNPGPEQGGRDAQRHQAELHRRNWRVSQKEENASKKLGTIAAMAWNLKGQLGFQENLWFCTRDALQNGSFHDLQHHFENVRIVFCLLRGVAFSFSKGMCGPVMSIYGLVLYPRNVAREGALQ